MKPLLIIANWKSNKTVEEAKNWLEIFLNETKDLDFSEKQIVICPSFPILFSLSKQLNDLEIKVGAQDVSRFKSGPYTGEVNAGQLKELVDYAIVGHSERRQNFKEDDQVLEEKVALLLENNIKPIFCVQDSNTHIPNGVTVVAYEPIFAIGSGTPDTPENAEKVAREIKERRREVKVVYGGSVSLENIKDFTKEDNIDGVLVGGQSLDPLEFAKIAKDA